MRKLKYNLSRMALNQIYFLYVIPVLEYSSLVWDGCSQHDSSTLEKLQHEAARIVTGLERSVSLENLYRECGWSPLSERRRQQKLTFMNKTFDNLVPIYITELIPPLTGDVSTCIYPLRNSNNIAIPFARSEILYRSCITSSVTLWNSLDQIVRTIDSPKCFKNHIKNSYITNAVPSFYLVGDRYFTVLNARIRNNCIDLNNDLYVNHLRADPLRNCLNENEDANHYFFKCVNYINQRVILFQTT